MMLIIGAVATGVGSKFLIDAGLCSFEEWIGAYLSIIGMLALKKVAGL